MKLTNKDYLFVTLQMILFVIYIFDILPKFKVPAYLSSAGVFVAVSGVVISVVAMLKLDQNLTAFPTPKANSELVSSGLYKFIRHPIYTGVILFVFGYAVFKMSIFKMILAVLLLILFWFKSKYEEKRLQEKYSGYSEYQQKTGRFFPKF